jgi:spermidine synthase
MTDPLAADQSATKSRTQGIFALPSMCFAIAFFASGAAALTYQFCWNRYLFAAIGVDLDSTSVIVATFMLGLGLGNLLGARLARAELGLTAFLVIELLLFGFGAASPWLLDQFTTLVLGYSRTAAACALFLLLLIPTLLMGATLPVMTAAAARVPALSGLNFSAMYLYNTLGGAAGAFCSAFVLIAWLGLSRTVWVAAIANLAAAGLCAVTIVLSKRSKVTIELTPEIEPPKAPVSAPMLRRGLWFSALAGLLALSIEIVWMRLFGLSYHQTPWVTPFVLGTYLLGLALGVILYRRVVKQKHEWAWADIQMWVANCFLISGAIDLIGGVGYLLLAPTGSSKAIAGFIIIVMSAASKGAILTAIADLPGANQSGHWVGKVMAANIAGATIGPLLTCYILFGHLSFQHTLYAIAFASLLCGLWARLSASAPWRNPLLITAAMAVTMALLPNRLLPRILDNGGFGQGAIKDVIETRHGVFHAISDPRGDVILGANLYDGRINIDPMEDLNGISRIYRVMASVPKVDRVLVIGLGSGSWLEVIRNFSDVKHIQVIELAPAYAELIKRQPIVAGVLNDPKIRFKYTDGLRWLHQNPDEKFDLIVMNTTFYWRSFATNLLSVEFLQQLSGHLNERGAILMNATESKDVVATFVHVFPQTTSISSMLLGPYQAPDNLAALRMQRLQGMGKLGEFLIAKHPNVIQILADAPLSAPNPGNGQLITQDNLRSEFSLYRPFSEKHFD